MKSKFPPLFLMIALCALAPRARAEADASSRALAVQLFDEAEALFSKGKVVEACPKYAESYRLDPQLGVLIYLAECYEKNGQVASAWGSYREAEELAQKRGDQRAAHAHERASSLEPQLSYVVIQVADSAKVPGLEVTRDGQPISALLWGSRTAIDPGKHLVEAHAAGYEAWQGEVTISGAGSSTSVDVPKLTAQASPVAATSTTTPPAPSSPAGGSRKIAALAVGGLSVVAIGVGGFFGLSAQSSFSDSKSLCGAQNYCTPRGSELRDSAKSKATVATIATGVGVAGLVTAAVLWFTAPKGDQGVAKLEPRRAWAVAPTTTGSWGLEVNHAF